MIHRIIFLGAILTANFYLAIAQIHDDFSDGNFTDDPAWYGDTSSFFVAADQQLQLIAPPESGFAFLSTPCQVINKAEWSFYVRMKFNPSSRNYMDIYIVADDSLLGNPLNGYFVRIGNTNDEVSLYKQWGSRADVEKIIDGRDDITDKSLVELRIKVTKSDENGWQLFVDDQLDGNFFLEGQAHDNSIYYSKYAGVVCSFTSTRSDKFFFDDLDVHGEIYTDQVDPWLDSLTVLSDSSIFLKFSEEMDLSTLLDPVNYEVDQHIGHPNRVIPREKFGAILVFSQKLEDRQSYQINLSGLRDLFSNSLKGSTFLFSYVAPYTVGYADILITEIMADPSPGVDLPEYEYLEIFNPKNERLVLEQVKLIVGGDTARIPDIEINPSEYIIICPFAAVEHLQPYGNAIRVPNWPSLNNRGERITLLNKNDELVYSVAYDQSWYKSIDKDDGGWAIEMIDTDFPCRGKENWSASEHPQGGTPGTANSMHIDMPDLTAPGISSVIATSDSSLTVYLDENIGPKTSADFQMVIQPEIKIQMIQQSLPELYQLNIDLDDKISPRVMYEIEISNLKDCANNIQKTCRGSFVLPEPADSNDLIINEVLFNPAVGGTDFVEIYNRSDKYINLNTLFIGNETYHLASEDNFIFNPQQLLAITEDPELLQNQYPDAAMAHVFKVKNLPPLNDDEGHVILVDANGKQIDHFQYSEELHSPFLHDVEGVSLERIDYERPTNEPSNWQSAASTAGFATPGRINSQFYPGNDQAEEVQVDPQVFDPGNNGFYDFTTIKCRFSNPGNMASIRILDAIGQEIRTLVANQSIRTEEDFKWEGLDNQGRKVKMGPYIVSVEVYDASGQLKLYRKKVVVGQVF